MLIDTQLYCTLPVHCLVDQNMSQFQHQMWQPSCSWFTTGNIALQWAHVGDVALPLMAFTYSQMLLLFIQKQIMSIIIHQRLYMFRKRHESKYSIDTSMLMRWLSGLFIALLLLHSGSWAVDLDMRAMIGSICVTACYTITQHTCSVLVQSHWVLP